MAANIALAKTKASCGSNQANAPRIQRAVVGGKGDARTNGIQELANTHVVDIDSESETHSRRQALLLAECVDQVFAAQLERDPTRSSV